MFFEYLFEMRTLMITTEKYDKLIFLYLDQIFGDRIKGGVGAAMEDYLYWINSDKVFLFEYIDKGFGIAESIYEKFISILLLILKNLKLNHMSFLSRIILALFFAAILISNAVAQRFNVRWGDNSRLNFDFVDAVPLANGQFIVLKLKHGPKMSFGKPEDLRPIFVLVDKNMESIREKEIEIEEKNATDRGFEKYGNKT